MAMFIAIDEAENNGIRRERIFRDRMDPFDNYNDSAMYQRYRFTRQGCQAIIDRLRIPLDHPTKRNCALPASLQVFIALRFFASGSKSAMSECASIHGCSKATCSRAIRRVALALCSHRHREIKFPTSPFEMRNAQRDFFEIAGFPQVVGAVDGTLIGLHGCNYGVNEYVFVSRKGRHAINVQLICSAKFKIINVVARWPGSTHDSRILQTSLIGQQMDSGALHGVLLGDSGYPLLPWLMTPIANPVTHGERAYNRAQTHTRSIVEQVNGQLKNKFRCLLGDGMHIDPARACDIIVACCVLFNISKDLKEPNIDPVNHPILPEPEEVAAVVDNIQGAAARAEIINNFFTNA